VVQCDKNGACSIPVAWTAHECDRNAPVAANVVLKPRITENVLQDRLRKCQPRDFAQRDLLALAGSHLGLLPDE